MDLGACFSSSLCPWGWGENGCFSGAGADMAFRIQPKSRQRGKDCFPYQPFGKHFGGNSQGRYVDRRNQPPERPSLLPQPRRGWQPSPNASEGSQALSPYSWPFFSPEWSFPAMP